jgi:crossover junction endodeoxyribonuclease RusA
MKISVPVPSCGYMTMNLRDHWRTKAAKTKAWREATCGGTLWGAYADLSHHTPPAELHFEMEVPDKRRRDPHNYYPTIKAIVDGLVDAQLWPDDTPEWVHTNEPTFVVVGRNQGPLTVTVTITPREVAA